MSVNKSIWLWIKPVIGSQRRASRSADLPRGSPGSTQMSMRSKPVCLVHQHSRIRLVPSDPFSIPRRISTKTKVKSSTVHLMLQEREGFHDRVANHQSQSSKTVRWLAQTPQVLSLKLRLNSRAHRDFRRRMKDQQARKDWPLRVNRRQCLRPIEMDRKLLPLGKAKRVMKN